MEIAEADAADPTVTSRHRSRAVRILVDRFMGTNPTALKNGVCPDCRRKWTTHTCSPDHPEQSSVVAQVEEEPIDKEAWDRVIVELKEMEKRYNLDPNRSIRETITHTTCRRTTSTSHRTFTKPMLSEPRSHCRRNAARSGPRRRAQAQEARTDLPVPFGRRR